MVENLALFSKTEGMQKFRVWFVSLTLHEENVADDKQNA